MVYIDNAGNMDSNILIRSLLLTKEAEHEETGSVETGTIECWGGGGIVADSKAELEYEESLQKIRNILEALSNKNKTG